MKEGTFDVILSGFKVPFYHTPELIREYYRLLKPDGILAFDEQMKETSMDDEKLEFYPHYSNRLKLHGFSIENPEPELKITAVTRVVGRKPKYEV